MQHNELIRNRIIGENQVSLRKTLGVNHVGCSVNCTYCTLGKQYTETFNGNRVKPELEKRG